MPDIEAIQKVIREESLDGWLFFDHHSRDPLAYRVLGFEPVRTATRRWYYFIPRSGEPKRLVHKVESFMLDALPGSKRAYAGWREQKQELAALLEGSRRIAMQYSPECSIPYVAMVDAGTLELVRACGVEVATSANLIQMFEARWTTGQLESHLEAGRRIDAVLRFAFEHIRATPALDEYRVQQYIRERFRESGLVTDHGPIVAVNANASNPHYEPSAEGSSEIKPGDLILIDLWAKLDQPQSVYYDITWTAYFGPEPPSEMLNVFEVVSTARDRAVARVIDAAKSGEDLRGFQVDDAARDLIKERGFGDCFFHRTGHSIGTEVHGTGANMDNLETHDDRRVLPWTAFSVEPGVYLPKFGIRSEVNVFRGDHDARVTGDIQRRLLTLSR